MVAVQVTKLSKRYGLVQALQPSDIHFADGALSVIVGPSGCGKTTLMRMIAGLEPPTTGTITLGRQRVDQLPAWDRDVAMVFQNYALYPHMTVSQNMQFPLLARKVTRHERVQRVQIVAERLEIAHLLERKPGQLSGGQMQRVALGRALVREPQAFLMDEPLSNLDAALRITMRAEIKRLQHELGTTMIYVTHDQVEAMTLGDQLIVMNKGTVQQRGTPTAIYTQPANIFVAAFIGNPPMNILACHHDGDTGEIVHEAFRLAATENEASAFLGIRPEAVLVTQGEDAAIQGTIYVVENLGKEILLTVQLGTDLVKAIVSPDRHFTTGERIGLTFPMTERHYFDQSGQRLAI